ncbi:unnamed protein product [Acanthoscelides obtectus]|uniref:FHA domain-containing protein n=1 Tax=Acanthoscelides obtectus TaxID=200917 RepID=A0A9P0KWK7_ACAOB|nr:unnamed protein product [Acanthoscelides obtectus]CAK1650933.1 Protein PELPK1 [Acanthoscelides obtectus]
MASSTSIDGDTFGSLILIRKKDGYPVPFDLSPGQVTFGGGDNADIRLKIADKRLRDMHCFIYIDENGVATLVNKAGDDTVKVNDRPVKKMHVLNHQDAIDVLGKTFLYENENLRCDEVQTGNAVPGISSRNTIHVLAQKKSPTKSPTLKVKSPVQRRRSSLRHSSQMSVIELDSPEKSLEGKKSLNRSSLNGTPRQVYAPVVEDVSPATPPNSKGDDAIKTPLNTPGLFEDLRKSVLQSRTRRSGKKEEPAVEESEQNINNKRGRNSSIASQSSVKKRRTITYSVEDASEVEIVEESVESFNSTEDWPEISQDQTDHEHRLSDLTIASFANQPFSKVLSEPRVRQMKSVRLSRHNKTIAVDNLDGPEPIVKCSFLLENGLREDLLDKSPKPSTSNFVKSTTSASSHFIRNKSLLIGSPASAKLKRLQQSPKTVKGSPKLNVSENLSKFVGLKQLMRRRTSLSYIFGIKNFMSAQNKSPKNDTIQDSMDETIVTDSSRSSRTLKLTENAKAIKSPRLSTNFTRTPLDAMKRSMSTPKSMKKLEYEILDLSAVKTPSSELQTRASKTSVTENAQNDSTRTNKVLASSIPKETVDADKTKRLSRASSRFDSSEYELLDLSKTVRVDQSRKGLLNTSGKRTLKNVFLNGNGPKNSILSPRGINSLQVKNAVETLKTYASLPDLNAAATRSTANTSKRSLSTSKHRNSAETFDVEKDKSVIDQYDDDLQEVSKTRKSSSTSQELDSPDIEIKKRSWSLRSSKSNTRAGGDDLEINRRSTRRSSACQYPADFISIDLSGVSGSLISLKTSSSDQSPDVIKICDLGDNLLEAPSAFRYDEGTVEADVTESLSRKQSASRKSQKNSDSFPRNARRSSVVADYEIPNHTRTRTSSLSQKSASETSLININDPRVSMSFSRRLTKTPTAGVITPLCESGAWETVQSRKSSPDINQLQMSLIRVLKTGSGNDEKLVSGSRRSMADSSIQDLEDGIRSTRASKASFSTSKLETSVSRTPSDSKKHISVSQTASPVFTSVSDEDVALELDPEKGELEKLTSTPKTEEFDEMNLTSKSTRQCSRFIEEVLNIPLSKASSVSTRDSNTPKTLKSPNNDLTGVREVKRLLKTPKSPEKNLPDIRGVKKLLQTPQVQKSPENDLSDFRGVKKLLRTPRVQKSPQNDLSNIRGVKNLLKTPKVSKSPENDLSDVRGVKKLLQTPKVQKSPKNDLSNIGGVRKLLKTPKLPKSPKNDLSDIRGVKKLLKTPEVPKSPENDLSDVRGVKKLLQTPKVQKSPKNDLSNIGGVKNLLKTPKVPKSPKNDLTDIRGVKKLLRTPKVRKSPKNDLSNIVPLKMLMSTPKPLKEHINDLSNVSGVKDLFIEKQEELFDSLFNKKPVRKYSGRLSTSRTEEQLGDQDDVDVSDKNEKVEQWVNQQDFNVEDSETLNEVRKTPKTQKNNPEKVGETVDVSLQKTRPKRGQNKTNENACSADILQEPEQKTRGKKRKVAEPAKVEVESISNNIEDKAIKTRRNEKAEVEVTVEKDTTKDVQEVAAKPVGRPRRNKKTELEETVEKDKAIKTRRNEKTEVEVTVEKDTTKDVQEVAAKPVGRPRRNKKTELEETVEKDSDKNIHDKAVKPAGRLRRNKKTELEETDEKDSDKNVQDKAVKPAGRLRRNKKTDIEETVEKDTSKDIECNAVKPAGRRNNKTVEEIVEEDSERDIQNKVVKTASRPRRNLKTKIEESVTSGASKTNVDESVKPISRSKRNEKAENGESIKNINKRTEYETASRSGDNKEKKIEKNDSEDKPMRITRGTKKVVNPSLNDETTSRRPKKDQTVESVKVTKGRQKKATLNEEDVEEEKDPTYFRRHVFMEVAESNEATTPVQHRRLKNKKVKEIEEEDPKRSRRAKGDYEKYGEEFVSESPLTAKRRRKK